MEFIHRALRRSGPRVAFAAAVSTALLGVSLPLHGPATPASTAHAAARTADAAANSIQASRPTMSLSRLPLLFEQGQGGNGPTSYVAHGNGYALALASGGPVLVSMGVAAHQAHGSSRPSPAQALHFQLLGSNPAARIVGEDRQEATVNYLVGANPKAWRTGVATFGRVAYQGIYPGINVTYYGTQGDLEYDFNLAPGANPQQIRLAFPGARSLSIDSEGDLRVSSVGGVLIEKQPVAYQVIGGERRPVSSRYALLGAHEAAFVLGAYQPGTSLVIDPVLTYSDLDGFNDNATGIAIDHAGSAYIVGNAPIAAPPNSTGIITQTYMLQGSIGGASAAFVAKLNPEGTRILYSTYLSGTTDAHAGNGGATYGTGIAVDTRGDAFVTGSSNDTDFPTTKGAFQITNRGGFDAFVTKLSPTGLSIMYSTLLGGADDNANTVGDDGSAGIALDSRGDAYIAGYTFSYNFPLQDAGQSALGYGEGTLGTQEDAFVAKFNPQGSKLIYSTYLGGSGTDFASGIAVDPKGFAYVTGQTNSADFRTPPHALQQHLSGTDFNSFVAKMSQSGNTLVYATYLGKTAADKSHGIAVDSAGNAYVVGETNGGILRTIGVPQPAPGGGIDAFVSKLSARGVLVYSTYLGGVGNDIGYAIALDHQGNAYVAGSTGSPTFTTPIFPLQQALQGTLGGNRGGFGLLDSFVTKVNSCGTAILYSSYFGGTFAESVDGIAVDARGNAYMAGYTQSPNFPLTHGLPGGRNYGPPNPNVFIAKISGAPQPRPGACPLPLTLDLAAPAVSVSAVTPISVTVHTAPFAKVQITLTVKNTVPPPAATPGIKVKGPKPPKLGQIIYRLVMKGTADAYGLYVGQLFPKIKIAAAVTATLAIHTSNAGGAANTVTTITIQP